MKIVSISNHSKFNAYHMLRVPVSELRRRGQSEKEGLKTEEGLRVKLVVILQPPDGAFGLNNDPAIIFTYYIYVES